MQGSAPGERRGGRQKGTKNKNTVAMGGENLVKLARKHCPEAVDKLVNLMQSSTNELVQQRAADSILDRGYGRPGQALMISGDQDNPLKHHVDIAIGFADKDLKT